MTYFPDEDSPMRLAIPVVGGAALVAAPVLIPIMAIGVAVWMAKLAFSKPDRTYLP